MTAAPLAVGSFLPLGELPSAPTGTPVPVRSSGRDSTVLEVSEAGTTHLLPAPREVEEWLKFLGTQCPE